MRIKDKRRLPSLFCLSISSTVYNKTNVIRYGDVNVKNAQSPYSFHYHNVLLVLILMIVWGTTVISFYQESITNIWFGVIVPIIIYDVFSLISTGCLCWNRLKHLKKEDNKSIIREKKDAICCKKNLKERLGKRFNLCFMWFICQNIALMLASPSWAIAKFYKYCITNKMGSKTEATKIEKTLFIAYKNMFNMLVSLLFAIPILIIDLNDFWTVFLMSVVVLRTLSRSFEITIAFGQDALDKEKSSLLTSPQRLMLAFTSLFECILNYTIAYYLVGYSVGEPICKWQAFVHSFQSALFFSNELLSNSLTSYKPTALAMLQVTQAITCMTLVFIAFVIYISKTTEDKNTTTRRV